MKTITVQVQDDHIEYLARSKPLNAVAELVWNALDAEATEVRVEFAQNDLGGIEAIHIRDNGHGLHYDHAQVVFGNLGGSWKMEQRRTAHRGQMLHGRYGKGRFRAFGLGNQIEWRSTYEDNGKRYAFSISGQSHTLAQFQIIPPEPADTDTGMTVSVTQTVSGLGALQGEKAVQDITDIFALYLRQYPGIRIIYDQVPLDPVTVEECSADYPLGEIVLENGERAEISLLVVEWLIPGKHGIVLCDADGFALYPLRKRLHFRGFSYTAYLKSAHFAALEREGLLVLEDMTPDVRQILEIARLKLHEHFLRRGNERMRDTIDLWKEQGFYPYSGAPDNQHEERERQIFNLYAVHAAQYSGFDLLPARSKRLFLRLIQELVRTDPVRIVRVLDEQASLPPDRRDALLLAIQ